LTIFFTTHQQKIRYKKYLLVPIYLPKNY